MQQEQQEAPLSAIRAVIRMFGGRDPTKPYALAYPQDNSSGLTPETSITFSMSDYHGGGIGMYKGMVVDLYQVTLSEKGWRAGRARPVTPPKQKQRRTA